MSIHRFFLCLILAIVSAGTSTAAVGPTSTLYLMNYGEFAGGNVVGLDMIQGLSVASVPTGNSIDICIAAYGDIRTYGYVLATAGSRFDLAGNPLPGGPYPNTYGGQMHDGTSDGLYNYSVDFVSGDIIQFDRDWANQVALFNGNGSGGTVGWITMNAADGSFWLSQSGVSDLVEQRRQTGTLLGSYNSGVAWSQGLALDPIDGTLWLSSGFTLYQYTQGGTLLQSLSYTMQDTYWYGMEFDTTPVPEPGCLSFAGLSAALFLGLRRLRLGSKAS